MLSLSADNFFFVLVSGFEEHVSHSDKRIMLEALRPSVIIRLYPKEGHALPAVEVILQRLFLHGGLLSRLVLPHRPQDSNALL